LTGDKHMLAGMLSLSHSEQQESVERIHQLMAQGMGSGEAIACVAQEIRQKHQSEQVTLLFDDEESQSHW
ncbi:MAG: YoaH family protein, partial [Serratia symbiotica]|nr:YoaH family protein [Serratia symbiotica]